MNKHINNPAPLAMSATKLQIGYTKAALTYGIAEDNDLSSVVFWVANKTTNDPETKTLYPYDINNRLFVLKDLVPNNIYASKGTLIDEFLFNTPSLVDTQSSDLMNIISFPEFVTKTPVSITSIDSRSSDLGQIGSPPNTLAVSYEGEADTCIVEILSTEGLTGSDSSVLDWSSALTLYKGPIVPSEVMALTAPAYAFVVKVTSSILLDGVGNDTAEPTYFGTPDNPVKADETTPNPSTPIDLVLTPIEVTGQVTSYNLLVDWSWAAEGNTGARRNAYVSYRVVGESTWSNATSLDDDHLFIGVPYRKTLEVAINIKGWNLNESDTLTGFIYISGRPEESSVPYYKLPIKDTDIPVDTTVQVLDSGIYAFSNWDGTSGEATFQLEADTGNVVIGATDPIDGVAPFTYDAVAKILSIKGQAIVDSIVSADYVMGWLDGKSPSFRSANRTSSSGYGESTSGIWMGYEDSLTFKMSLGNGSKYLKWTGEELIISSAVRVGDDGTTAGQKTKYVQIYRRSPIVPSLPTDGSYDDPVPTSWYLTIPPYDGNACYMSYRTFTSDGAPLQDPAWAPVSVISEAIDTARLVQLTSTGQVFRFDKEGVSDKASITITAETQNISNPTFLWETVGGSGTSSGNTYTIQSNSFGLGNTITVKVTVPTPNGDREDSITIVKIQDALDGTSSLVGYLTNEAHTIAANADGSISNYTGASGSSKLFYGVLDITTESTFVLSSVTPGLVVSLNSSGYYQVSSLTVDSAVATITMTHPIYGSFSKIFSVSKSVKGETGPKGESSKSVSVSSSSQVFRFDAEGNSDLEEVVITATAQNIDNPTYTWENVGGVSSGNTYTIHKSAFGSGNSITAKVSVSTEDGTRTDSITIIKVQDAKDGLSNLSGYLTNESHTVSANADGSVSSYAGASGNVKVYYGTSDVTSGSSFTLGTKTSGLGITLSAAGFYQVTSLSVDSAVATINITHPEYGTFTKIFSISKALEGGAGSRGPGTYTVKYLGTWSTTFNNSLAAAAAAGTRSGAPVLDDVVTVYNGNNPKQTPHIVRFNGSELSNPNLASSWSPFEWIVHGDALVEGTLRGDRLIAGTEISSPLIKGGRIEVGGNTDSEYRVILDSTGESEYPLTVLDKSIGGKRDLMLGWSKDSLGKDQFRFKGTIAAGKIDSLSVFSQGVLDIIAPKVQGTLGGIQKVSGSSSVNAFTVTVPVALANTLPVQVSFSGGGIVEGKFIQPNQKDVWNISLQRSKNQGTWTSITSWTHTSGYRREDSGTGYVGEFSVLELSYEDSSHGASDNDTLQYRLVAQRNSSGSSVSLIYKISNVTVAQPNTGGGLEGIASSASFPYIGLDTSEGSTYPRMLAKNNPSSDPNWVRVPSGTGGILPYLPSQSSIGASTWKFGSIHSVDFVEDGQLLSNKYLIKAGTAAAATKLSSARLINGTSFNGTANITTAKWGAARTLTLTGGATGSVTLDGSGNISMATTIVVSSSSHNHDDRYYTEYESDTRFASKSHIHGGHDVRVLGNRMLVSSDGIIELGNSNYCYGGVYGMYSASRIGHIWGMGSSFKIDSLGRNFGNFYGFAYKHTTNTTGGTMGGGHQVVWVVNGTARASLGEAGIWTAGTVWAGGEMKAKASNGTVSRVLTHDDFLPANPPAGLENTITANWIGAGAINARHLQVNSVINTGGKYTSFKVAPEAERPISLSNTDAAGNEIDPIFYVDTKGNGYFKGKLSKDTVDIESIQDEARRQINPYYLGTVTGGSQSAPAGSMASGAVYTLPAIKVLGGKVNISWNLGASKTLLSTGGNPGYTAPVWRIQIYRGNASGALVFDKNYTGTARNVQDKEPGMSQFWESEYSIHIEDQFSDKNALANQAYTIKATRVSGTPTSLTRRRFEGNSPAFKQMKVGYEYTTLYYAPSGTGWGNITLSADYDKFEFLAISGSDTSKKWQGMTMIPTHQIANDAGLTSTKHFMLQSIGYDSFWKGYMSGKRSIVVSDTNSVVYRVWGVNMVEKE